MTDNLVALMNAFNFQLMVVGVAMAVGVCIWRSLKVHEHNVRRKLEIDHIERMAIMPLNHTEHMADTQGKWHYNLEQKRIEGAGRVVKETKPSRDSDG